MPITKNNFTHVTDTELEGVETTMFTVDFINSMAAETGDLSTGSSTAGLEATRAVDVPSKSVGQRWQHGRDHGWCDGFGEA